MTINFTASTTSLVKKAQVSLGALSLLHADFRPKSFKHVQNRIPQTERTLQLLVSYRL
jgi:hypothetical protein